ncbi:MAG: PqqD family protein [Congregibacter sp.]
MILTVFVAANDDAAQASAELTEYAWQRAKQSGEIVRLVPCAAHTALPRHARCRVQQTLSWTQHPYIDDCYEGYELPAALLQWLGREALDASVLLLDHNCLQRASVRREAAAGQACAQRWPSIPSGDGPFGLSASYSALRAFCVNRELPLPGVRLPMLMHSTELLRIAPRWLELTGIIRHDIREGDASPSDAIAIALNIACAEYCIAVTAEDFDAQIIRADASSEDFTAHRSQLESRKSSGEWLQELRPVQRPGVRQGRVLDQVYLESGWPPRASRLNGSAAVIWSRCDGSRSLWQIADDLHQEYQVPLARMLADVEQTALLLQEQSVITLKTED